MCVHFKRLPDACLHITTSCEPNSNGIDAWARESESACDLNKVSKLAPELYNVHFLFQPIESWKIRGTSVFSGSDFDFMNK